MLPFDPDDDDPVVVLDRSVAIDPAELAGVPRVVVSDGGTTADVVVAGDDELAEVTATICAHAEAAVALAMLLRGSDTRPVAEGLVAESATYAALQGGRDHRRWLEQQSATRPPRHRATDDAGSPVLVERDGDLLRIRLNRPDVRNAYDAATRDALVEALAIAAADPSVRVELRGNGPSFCSGGDLDEFGTMDDPAVAHRIRLRRSPGRAIAAIAGRITAYVHGSCVGAGVELPSFAGRVVAASDATFWLPELGMGLVPGAGGTVSITSRVGRQRCALLGLTGCRIDATTALEWGLVDEVEA